ncbi:hypothetical protein Pint_01881 [Pistacia integerrima]|uniref:Uncharacterized protein n=1 Tax=Pistacia integerrima TaxID=434235 RepID=A0ACC0ZPZ9_9ROSI|nr:hypothetical protein Pint_01881 [Pistacia integerrima]
MARLRPRLGSRHLCLLPLPKLDPSTALPPSRLHRAAPSPRAHLTAVPSPSRPISSLAPATSPSSIAFPPSQAPAPAKNAAVFNKFAVTGSLAVGLFAAVLTFDYVE